MAADAIKTRATAAKLYKDTGDKAIEGYKTMPLAELQEHITRIQKGASAPAKGKAAVNGAKANGTPVKGKAAASVPAKGKGSASTSAPAAKSTAQKSSPAKGKAAQGEAKRPTAAAGKGKATTAQGAKAPAKGRPTAMPAKGKTTPAATGWQPGSRGRVPASATQKQLREHKRILKERAAERAAKPPMATGAKRAVGKRGQIQGRSVIDPSAVNWDAEWNGGRTGKRKKVMDKLREHNGDYDKVFKALKRYAEEWYPNGGSAGKPESMLRWLIGRVAFDFVSKTGQHEKGTRAAYGESTDAKNVRRRELREERRKEQEREARKAKRQASAPVSGKPGARGKVPAKRGAASPAKGKGR